jgi:hypothetical protein
MNFRRIDRVVQVWRGAVSLALALMGCAAQARAADPMASLGYLVGTWNCTYRAGSQQTAYTATFAYAIGNNWMRERDTSTSGAGGENFITYQPTEHAWTSVVIGSDRTTTLFRANGGDDKHIAYRSVYPNANLSDVFDRVSPTKYTLHFSGTVNSQPVTSVDVCTKR